MYTSKRARRSVQLYTLPQFSHSVLGFNATGYGWLAIQIVAVSWDKVSSLRVGPDWAALDLRKRIGERGKFRQILPIAFFDNLAVPRE